MREQRDELDKALDAALASYGEAPENEGLERRVLARVAERTRRAYRIGPLAMAIGAAAVAVMACLLWRAVPKAAVQTGPGSTTALALREMEAPRIRTIPAPVPAGVAATSAKPRRVRAKPAEPKLAQFPTPSPLSSEERALVQLVTRNANYIPRELTDSGSSIKPIQITAVEIKPLRPGW